MAKLFCDLTGAERLAIRLEVVNDDACRLFHTDNVGYRLVTTYRGPGTQWVDPACGSVPAEVPAAAIRQMERGWIGVMRGRLGATPEVPTLLHRSLPIEGKGITRLFLAIDDAPVHRRDG